MSEPAPSTVFVWQPITPRGVAAFSRTSFSLIFLVQFLVALFLLGTIIWFLATNFSPVINALVKILPEEARLQNGELQNLPERLSAETKFLSVTVDLADDAPENQAADVQIQLNKREFGISSIPSSMTGAFWREYPKDVSIPLGRSVAEPWWGARKPFIIILTALFLSIGIFISWFVFATIYFLPVKIIAYFADRELSISGSWKLSAAAQMPGALFMALVIALYTVHAIDLIRFVIFWGMHLLITWSYLFIAPFFLMKNSVAVLVKTNPFQPSIKP